MLLPVRASESLSSLIRALRAIPISSRSGYGTRDGGCTVEASMHGVVAASRLFQVLFRVQTDSSWQHHKRQTELMSVNYR